MKLEWSLFAVADREQIFDTIEADNPRAAVSLDDRLQERIETLLEYPLTGRTGRVEGTRELVIAYTPYIAVYRIANDAIRILRVLHGARQWPDKFSEP